MNRHADHRGRLAGTVPDNAGLTRGNVLRGKMHTVSAAGQGDIGSRIDQQLGGRSSGNGSDSLASQLFQLARTQVLFAQLYEIYPGYGAFTYLCEQMSLACVVIPCKLLAIGDVAKQKCGCPGLSSRCRHQTHNRWPSLLALLGPPSSSNKRPSFPFPYL